MAPEQDDDKTCSQTCSESGSRSWAGEGRCINAFSSRGRGVMCGRKHAPLSDPNSLEGRRTDPELAQSTPRWASTSLLPRCSCSPLPTPTCYLSTHPETLTLTDNHPPQHTKPHSASARACRPRRRPPPRPRPRPRSTNASSSSASTSAGSRVALPSPSAAPPAAPPPRRPRSNKGR